MSTLEKQEFPNWPEWLARRWPARLAGLDFPEFDDWFDRSGMRVEQFRDGDDLVVRAEMPGIDPDKDLEITVSDGVLSVEAERREESENKGDRGAYRSEFRYGRFVRRVGLPAGANEDAVTASYNDGILEVRLPVADEATKARKIEVTRD
jgi:HSP20 family protein